MIHISGQPDAVMAAKATVEGLMAEGPSPGKGAQELFAPGGKMYSTSGLPMDKDPGCEKPNARVVEVPKELVGLVLGKKWVTLQQMRDESGAQCWMDQHSMGEEEARKVVCWGEPPNVQELERRIL